MLFKKSGNFLPTRTAAKAAFPIVLLANLVGVSFASLEDNGAEVGAYCYWHASQYGSYENCRDQKCQTGNRTPAQQAECKDKADYQRAKEIAKVADDEEPEQPAEPAE